VRFRQLRHFCLILDCGSLSRAAATAKIAQSALSRQVAELEAQIGVELLHRTPRGVKATRAGEVVYREAMRLLKRLDQIPSLIQADQATLAGTARLGISSIFESSLATAIVTACKETMPKVALKLVAAESATLRMRVEAQELDLAIIFENDLLVPTLTRQPLFQQQLYFAASPRLYVPSTTVSLSYLAGLPLIMPSESNFTWTLFVHALSKLGLSPTVVAEVEDTPGLMSAVAAGLGGAILPMGKLPTASGESTIRLSRIEPPLCVIASIVSASESPLTRAGDAMRALLGPLVKHHLESERLSGAEWIGLV
jgi:LysR family transcriptional regulator, nitrogen assimilation regulatory protein